MTKPGLYLLSLLSLLGACAAYSGSGLQPGVTRLAEVEQSMGQPALRWHNADGSQQLAYPRGPAGFDTFMVSLGPDGRLQSIENVLDARHLERIRPGMNQEQVLRTLGPPDRDCTVYFKARDELVWDWRFRAVSGEASRMLVLFDNSAGTVRSTMVLPERKGLLGGC